MKEFSVIFESTFLYEVEIIKSKLLSEGIECSINNEFVNNVAVMPMSNFYQLIVKTEDLEQSQRNHRKAIVMMALFFPIIFCNPKF